MEETSYKDAGVDIDAANRATEQIKKLARSTFTPNVLSDIGSFGGMFRADFAQLREPVLVSSTDGIGTKLRIAFMTGIHNTVGYDLVCHCINDILVQGARPLFFLDYIATGKLAPDTIGQIVEGLARGCREAGCALIGGETAEMPGFYADGEYDVAGFIVGIVDRPLLIDGRQIQPGDVLLGLPSAGLHTNGYSLARKILFEIAGFRPDSFLEEPGTTVADALLSPHRSYLPSIDGLLGSGAIKGLAHITGGGLLENLPRILPDGTAIEIQLDSWPVPPIFTLMKRLGTVTDREMFRTFNMGIGLVIVTSRETALAIESHLSSLGERYYQIGHVVEGGRTVEIKAGSGDVIRL
ncbi:MAG TPA: phosphoribosylformylglycinamidine cyclo-ligase [Blastocatellia bacterium]